MVVVVTNSSKLNNIQLFGVWGLGFGVWGLGFGVWVTSPRPFVVIMPNTTEKQKNKKTFDGQSCLRLMSAHV